MRTLVCEDHCGLVCEVTQLQTRFAIATIGDLKAANRLVDRAKTHKARAGLHYRQIPKPVRVADVSDASHATKITSYAHEGNFVFLMHDGIKDLKVKDHTVTADTEYLLGGVVHPLVTSSHKSKRVSHSTSHAENLSACSGVQNAPMDALRLTEVEVPILYKQLATVSLLVWIDDNAKFVTACDHYTGCHDLLDLVTGLKSVPTDKSQRLAVISLREDRLNGRTRHWFHIPTTTMVADGLTKPGLFPLLMELLTCGHWSVKTTAD